MNAPTTAPGPLVVAITRFADVWQSGALVNEVAGSLSCVEADALARVFRAAGRPEDAEMWTSAHTANDAECEEQHGARVEDESGEDPMARVCESCGAEPGEPCNPHMICG